METAPLVVLVVLICSVSLVPWAETCETAADCPFLYCCVHPKGNSVDNQYRQQQHNAGAVSGRRSEGDVDNDLVDSDRRAVKGTCQTMKAQGQSQCSPGDDGCRMAGSWKYQVVARRPVFCTQFTNQAMLTGNVGCGKVFFKELRDVRGTDPVVLLSSVCWTKTDVAYSPPKDMTDDCPCQRGLYCVANGVFLPGGEVGVCSI